MHGFCVDSGMFLDSRDNLAPGQLVPTITRDWLTERLALPRDGTRPLHGDVLDRPDLACADAVPASVLFPIVNRRDGPTVLLTQRTAHLGDHAGQISFPGGRAELIDRDATDTALREAEEEVGLARRHVEILGVLPEYWTVTGYRVTPVVAWIEPPFDLELDSFEVAEVFEVPLDFLLDPAHHERHAHEHNGVRRHYYAMPFEGRFIWGATAAMIVNLYRILAR